MNDTQITERSARAIGLDPCGFWIRGAVECRGPDASPGFGDFFRWHPLASGDHCMHLVKTLKLTVAPEPSRGGWSVGAVVNGEFKWLAHGEDAQRAIAEAAASLPAASTPVYPT